jgi:hypothetical protein
LCAFLEPAAVDEAIEQLRKRTVKIVSEPHDVAPADECDRGGRL